MLTKFPSWRTPARGQLSSSTSKRCPQTFSLGNGHSCHGCPRSPGFRRSQADSLREECPPPPVSSMGHEMPQPTAECIWMLRGQDLVLPLEPKYRCAGVRGQG